MSGVVRFNREKHLELPEGKICSGCGQIFISQAVCPHCAAEAFEKSKKVSIELGIMAAAINQVVAQH
jgi:hypothetical protein